jgi:hypothetical protein
VSSLGTDQSLGASTSDGVGTGFAGRNPSSIRKSPNVTLGESLVDTWQGSLVRYVVASRVSVVKKVKVAFPPDTLSGTSVEGS